MSERRDPRYPIFDQYDREKLRNEMFIIFFIPATLVIVGMALLLRFVIGDWLAGIHPAFAEPIYWSGGGYNPSTYATARFQLMILVTSVVLIVHFYLYIWYLRPWYIERGWV